ncbi:COL6A [Mytilus coruscus]|uniref:COL6A n=1 Tax=Mytilus coruscus TaxID=42192 RepID=A0A6J8BVK2_MYTCO|nr:COL6A [Mytilus coruscus]
MKTFCKNVLDAADIESENVKVGVLSYSTDPKVHFFMNKYSTKISIKQAIDGIAYKSGGTNIADALKKLRTEMFKIENGDRPGVRNVAMMLTDGLISTIKQSETIQEANKTRAESIYIYAISSKMQGITELSAIVTSPASKHIIDMDNDGLMKNLSSRVFKATCQEQLCIVPTLYVSKGNPVTLHCNVSDNPCQTEVYLEKIKKFTVNDTSDSTTKHSNFTIKSMNYSDEGTYMCYSGNSTTTSQINTSVVLKLLEDTIQPNISKSEIDKKVLELKQTLEIRKNETTKYRSLKACAKDDRLSSAVMGYVGVMVVVSIISLFVFFDCLSIWQYYFDR